MLGERLVLLRKAPRQSSVFTFGQSRSRNRTSHLAAVRSHHESSGYRYITRAAWLRPLLIAVFFSLTALSVEAANFFVATTGNDTTGNGSSTTPWRTIGHAVRNVPDGSTILVRPGTYTGRIDLVGNFATGVTIRSEIPYQAILRNNDRVITCYSGHGITIEGFDIAHSGAGAAPLVVHIDGAGNNSTTRITVRNNILHDSFNNDILKVNNAAKDVLVVGNVFYNQTGSDEHIDINSVENVTVQDNIFFNDFAGSGRTNSNETSSFIVIKDSNAGDDMYTGTRSVTVRRNVFLNWEGSTGSNFVLIGEDGNPFFEAFDVLVENNLMLGNSANVMRSSFGVKGGRDITFRNNTVSGDLPSLAFAMRLNREGSNPANQNIRFFNNVWSDPNGTMGGPGTNDFSDTPPADTTSFVLQRDLYWNGASSVPSDAAELINFTNDSTRIVANPQLTAAVAVLLPRWVPATGLFADGTATVQQAFQRLAQTYGRPLPGSALIDAADSANAAADDILGRPRSAPDIGAYELESTCAGVTLSLSSQSFSSAAGIGSFAVNSPGTCSWIGVSAAGWISITSPPSVGNGTVTYSVTANLASTTRSAIITVAGQTFTVLQGARFADVPPTHPFFEYIGRLSARGITAGCGGGNFCPSATVVRAQMAVFMEKGMGILNPPTPASQRFTDVPPTHFAYAFVDDSERRGVIQACASGQFCPDVLVTRADMAVFVERALGVFNPPTPTSQRFLDVPPTHPAYAFIDDFARRGITAGCGSGNYCPSLSVTRGEMAVFLVRAFRL